LTGESSTAVAVKVVAVQVGPEDLDVRIQDADRETASQRRAAQA
jgi:hypothetical protein